MGKTTVAKSIAEEFNLKYLSGGDVLKEMAKEDGFDTAGDDWWDTPDGMRFLNKRAENPEFDKKVDEKLKDLFYKGGVVITSYTLPWLVNDGIKIWLDGSHQSSASRMTMRDNMPNEEALEITKKRYDENKSLYKKLYNFNFGADMSVFDKIINTDGLTAQEVIQISKKTVRELL